MQITKSKFWMFFSNLALSPEGEAGGVDLMWNAWKGALRLKVVMWLRSFSPGLELPGPVWFRGLKTVSTQSGQEEVSVRKLRCSQDRTSQFLNWSSLFYTHQLSNHSPRVDFFPFPYQCISVHKSKTGLNTTSVDCLLTTQRRRLVDCSSPAKPFSPLDGRKLTVTSHSGGLWWRPKNTATITGSGWAQWYDADTQVHSLNFPSCSIRLHSAAQRVNTKGGTTWF